MNANSANNHNADLSNSGFLDEVLYAAPRGTTVWVNAFIGNPNSQEASWGGKAYSPATMLAEVDGWQKQNTYFSVAAVRRAPDGTLSRRKTHFARLLVLVADDVDPTDLIATPSYGIETSPGKRQVGVLLDSQDPDCSNLELVTRLVTVMAEKGFIKADKSGNNAVRYVRLPVGQNQKPRDSGPFSHVLEYWNPSIRYSLEDAASVFGIDLDSLRHAQENHEPMPSMVAGEQDERLRVLTANIIRGENLHDSVNMVAASMVASGAKGGAIVNLLRGLMDASLAPKDDRWLARYQDISRSVSTAQEKFRLKETIVQPVEIDAETGEIIERKLFVKVSDLLSDLKPVQWLVENYLETDALSMVFGPSGGGKSFVVVDMACCIATGTPWHGMPVKQGAVFYIAGEGHNGLARRFAAWQKARSVPLNDDVPLYKSSRAVMFLDESSAQQMSDEVERLAAETGKAPQLVIIDTLARNFGDGDENKQQDANMFIEHMDKYIRRKWNCNVMVVHHSGHDMDRARGSSAFKGAMDQELWIKGAAGRIDLKVTKMKDAEVPADRRFKIEQVGLGIEDDCGVEIQGAYIEPDGNPLEFKVGSRTNGTDLLALDVAKAMYPAWPGTPPMVASLACSERSLSRIMKAMKDNGMASQKVGSKGWELTEAAIDHLSMTGCLAMGGA
jgi:hypothetical protein